MTFRDLNCGLGCSPLATHPYDVPLFPKVDSVYAFGVGQDTEEFLPQNTQSVALPHKLPRLRLDYDQF